MSTDPLEEYDFALPKDDDCWHLDAPHHVEIKSRSDSSRIFADYDRVGINARSAWETGTDGRGIKVVIFDTGVDYLHPSLALNIEPVLADAADFDHTVGREGKTHAERGRIDNRSNAHGTACAGLVGAIKPAASEIPEVRHCRVVGVAPKAWLLPIRISANFHIESLIGALEYARQKGDVILMPRTWPDKDDVPGVADLKELITRIAGAIPVVCASGNSGTSELVYPAFLKETIAVGACNDRGYRSSYSQFGEGLDVVAPSNDLPVEDRKLTRLDIDEVDLRKREKQELEARLSRDFDLVFRPQGLRLLSSAPEAQDKPKLDTKLDRMGLLSIATTDNRGEFGYNFEPPGDYCKATGDFGFGGTSAAAAQVAGVIALMLAANEKLKGNPAEVQRLLRKASSHKYLTCELSKEGKSTESDDGKHSDEFGFGLIDAERAVALACKT